MMRATLILICCFLSLSVMASVEVIQYEQTELPLKIHTYQDEKDLHLRGYALNYRHGEKMYVGAIYSCETANDLDGLFDESTSVRMHIEILQDKLDEQTAALIWMDSVVVNNPDLDADQFADNILEFKRAITTTYKKGDVIDIEYTPNQGMKLYINQTLKGQWQQKSFFNMALNVWVGPHPPSRDFKRAILNFPVH